MADMNPEENLDYHHVKGREYIYLGGDNMERLGEEIAYALEEDHRLSFSVSANGSSRVKKSLSRAAVEANRPGFLERLLENGYSAYRNPVDGEEIVPDLEVEELLDDELFRVVYDPR